MLFLVYLLIGTFAGTLSGLLGIGGGLVVVPLLSTIFETIEFPPNMIMHYASGTSLAVMMITTTFSLRSHIKLGNQIWPIFKHLMPGILLGTISGALIADFLQSNTLEKIFGVVLLVAALRAFFGKTKGGEHTLPGPWLTNTAGYVIGTLSGLLGIGGGLLLTPYLFHYNVNVRLAFAISAACGVLVSTIGTLSYMVTGANEPTTVAWTSGYIYWPAFIGISLMSPIFAYVGANLSHKLPVEKLKILFSLLIFIASIKMLLL